MLMVLAAGFSARGIRIRRSEDEGDFGGTAYNTAALQGVFVETCRLTATTTVTGDVTPTPEPATTALLGADVAAFAFRAKLGSAGILLPARILPAVYVQM
jgi:hypothetical protein